MYVGGVRAASFTGEEYVVRCAGKGEVCVVQCAGKGVCCVVDKEGCVLCSVQGRCVCLCSVRACVGCWRVLAHTSVAGRCRCDARYCSAVFWLAVVGTRVSPYGR